MQFFTVSLHTFTKLKPLQILISLVSYDKVHYSIREEKNKAFICKVKFLSYETLCTTTIIFLHIKNIWRRSPSSSPEPDPILSHFNRHLGSLTSLNQNFWGYSKCIYLIPQIAIEVCHVFAQIEHAVCSDVCHTTQFSHLLLLLEGCHTPHLTCSYLLPQDNTVNELDCVNNPY